MMANYIARRISPDFEQRYPDSNTQSTECAMNLVHTVDLMLKRISSLVQPFGLSPTSGLALSILADSDQPLPPNQIAERLIISRASVTSLLDSLEKRGYVQRHPHQSDRRMLLIELTDTGRQAADAFRPIVHQQEKVWMEVLSAEEQGQLLDFLGRLQATLADSDGSDPAEV
jgi:DNA-binding MarR family transcriptional regulator